MTRIDRRDLFRSIGMASSLAMASGAGLGQLAQDGPPPLRAGLGSIDIKPLDPDYFIADRFKGKTVVVTGSARGMGALAATRLAREGANVVGVDWIKGEGEATIQRIIDAGGKAVFIHGDISEGQTCDAMVRMAVQHFGGLDCALNNAGVMDGVYSGAAIDYEAQKHLLFAPVHEATDEYWDNVMRTNATGMFKSMRAELRQMVKQNRGGAIVNVGSVTGLTGFGGTPAYVASKHAVTGITRSAAIDYAANGIRINSVNMAQTATPMVERALQLVTLKLAETAGDKGMGMSMLKKDSLLQAADSRRRDATPAEQVAVMLFLLSGEASNLTGGVFATDGGWTAY